MARHDDQSIVRFRDGLLEIGRDRELGREVDVGKVAVVAPRARHRGHVRAIAAPEHRRVAAAHELYCERSAPRARAENGEPTRCLNACPRRPAAALRLRLRLVAAVALA